MEPDTHSLLEEFQNPRPGRFLLASHRGFRWRGAPDNVGVESKGLDLPPTGSAICIGAATLICLLPIELCKYT